MAHVHRVGDICDLALVARAVVASHHAGRMERARMGAQGARSMNTRRAAVAAALLNRTYLAGNEAVGLYIAYYRAQRPGVSVHSPLHCLPGTGWEAEDARTIDFAGAAADSQMKRLIVRKNLNRAVVLYGYSVQGRLIADEMLSKLWLLRDRIQRGRGDAALVRVVVPVTGTIEAAERRGLAFTRDFLP